MNQPVLITQPGVYHNIYVDAAGIRGPAITIRVQSRSKYKPVSITLIGYWVLDANNGPAVRVFAGRNAYISLYGGLIMGNTPRKPLSYIRAKRTQARRRVQRKTH